MTEIHKEKIEHKGIHKFWVKKSFDEFIDVKQTPKEKPYYYVRFVWWKSHNLEELVTKLKERFTLVERASSKMEQSEFNWLLDLYPEIEIRADTLSVFLSANRAVLFQREKASFTRKDMELREAILDSYPKDRPTPFHLFSRAPEPKFEKEGH